MWEMLCRMRKSSRKLNNNDKWTLEKRWSKDEKGKEIEKVNSPKRSKDEKCQPQLNLAHLGVSVCLMLLLTPAYVIAYHCHTVFTRFIQMTYLNYCIKST